MAREAAARAAAETADAAAVEAARKAEEEARKARFVVCPYPLSAAISARRNPTLQTDRQDCAIAQAGDRVLAGQVKQFPRLGFGRALTRVALLAMRTLPSRISLSRCPCLR
jgi:hypothetical protein